MNRVNFIVTPALLLWVGVSLFGQAGARLAGEYVGMLGPYHVKLHLTADSNGKLTGTADNTDTGPTGMGCENIRAEGTTLSFSVPMAQGNWTGFVSADGNTLSGMWSQGAATPVALNFTRSTGTSQGGGSAGPAGANAQGEVKWDDYTFRFLPGGTMTQVFQGGKLVGTILTMNGQERVVAQPGTDSAKLQKSYDDYQAFNARSHGEPAPTAATVAAGAPDGMAPSAAASAVAAGAEPKSLGFANNGKADPSGIKFEGKTVTVPRTDGMIVTFVEEDVTISDARGPVYILRHKKGSVGRTLEQTFDHRNAVGGGVAGGGIEFLKAGGGLIYDSGMGGYNMQESPGVRTAKQLALVAVDAADAVRGISGHAGFKPPGYGALKDVSQYRLRSDGSR
jgi:hypothetical protein